MTMGACSDTAEKGAMMAPVKALGLAGLLGAAVFLGSLILLQMMHTDVDWMRHYMSDFVYRPLGWIFVFGAVVHGLGNLCLGLGLRQSLDPGRLRAWAVFLFGLAAAGVVVAGLFPTDPGGRAKTPIGFVHLIATTTSFPLELGALLVFSAAFRRHPYWRRRAAASLAFSAVAATGLAGLFLAVHFNQLPGLAERLALASFFAWEFWAALVLARPARGVAR